MCLWTCKRQFPYTKECWCTECVKDDADKMEQLYIEWHAEQESQRIAATEATDAEYAAHLDTIAPKVGDQATEWPHYRLRFLQPGEPWPRMAKPFVNDDPSFETI